MSWPLLATLAVESCESCPSRLRGLCLGWQPAEIASLASIKLPPRSIPAGAALYRQGEPMDDYLVVVEGWVALRVMLQHGTWHIPDVALPGGLLMPLQGGAEGMDHSAICLTPVKVCTLPRSRLNALASDMGSVGIRLAQLSSHREARLRDHFASISGRPARERVAHLFVELFYRSRHSLPRSAGEVATIPLNLGHLGEALGLTAVHVSRTLGVLREQRIMRFFRQRMEVLDPEGLLRAAGFEADFAAFADEALGRAMGAPLGAGRMHTRH